MALPKSGLFSLPAEIRNTIYDQTFDADISNADMLALMKTSQQLHLEAGSRFYANNPFTVSFPVRQFRERQSYRLSMTATFRSSKTLGLKSVQAVRLALEYKR
ncbi:hypothetical protein PMIN06_008691 [Paraphaeosphaeria minitans]